MRYPAVAILAILADILLTIGASGAAHTYVRPVPQIPVIQSPHRAVDVFSINLLSHIHANLFRLNASNQPIPELVSSFVISQDLLEWRLNLVDKNFHDGTRLTAQHVIDSLTRSLKRKTAGFGRLSAIAGFDNFIQGKSNKLVGLLAAQAQQLVIKLSRPDPDLPKKLTDLAFAVVRASKSPQIGLGPYRVNKVQTDRIVLTAVSPTAAFSQLIFRSMNKEQALKAFRQAQVTDLFFYPIKQSELEKLGAHQLHKVYAPRTYFISYNAHKLSLHQRQAAMSKIDRLALVRSCYGINRISNSIVPPGMYGFNDVFHIRPGQAFLPKRRLRIGVMQGVGAEACVKSYLEKKLNANTTIDSAQNVTDDWRSQKYDAMFGYIEADNTLNLLYFFRPDARPTLGLPSDPKMVELIKDYHYGSTVEEKSTIADSIVKHIVGLQTFQPLFHPEVLLVLSKNYHLKASPVLPPTYLRVNQVQPKKKGIAE